MNIVRKSAKRWLKESSRRSFNSVLDEAKITPRQVQIAEMIFSKGMTNYQVAMEMNISVSTVDREIKTTYDAINRVLAELE